MLNNQRFNESNLSIIPEDLMKRFLLIPQVMKELGLSRHTIYKLVAETKLKAYIEEQGARTVFKFDPKEVSRVKEQLKKHERGKRLI